MRTWLTLQYKINTYNLVVGGVGQGEWCGEWKYIHAHVFINPARVCLLVGAFNPFTFRVIINMYDPIIVFLIVLGLFSVGLFLLLCLLPREVPLAFIVKLVWWCWILFNFCLSVKLLISPSNLNKKESCWVDYSWL